MSGLRKPRNRGPKGPIGLTGSSGPAGSTSVSSATPIWFDGQDAEDVFPIPGPSGPTGVSGLIGAMGMPGLDGIDGEDAIAPLGWPAFGVTTVTTAVTGAQNDYAPGLGKFTVEHWSGVADAAFTGLRGGAAGHVYIFKNAGTKIATFAHQSGASAAGNQLTNPVTSAPIPVAKNGSLTYVHNGTSWQLIAHQQGAPITPVFAAGVFTANGTMTWTVDPGDVQGFAYVVDAMRGLMTVYCALATTTIGGVVNTNLLVAIPSGFTSALIQVNCGGRVSDNGTDFVGLLFTTGSASTQINVQKYPVANYTLSTNNSTVQFTITFQVN